LLTEQFRAETDEISGRTDRSLESSFERGEFIENASERPDVTCLIVSTQQHCVKDNVHTHTDTHTETNTHTHTHTHTSSNTSTQSFLHTATIYSQQQTIIAQFAITINSNVGPHIRVPNMLMRESYADIIGIFNSEARY